MLNPALHCVTFSNNMAEVIGTLTIGMFRTVVSNKDLFLSSIKSVQCFRLMAQSFNRCENVMLGHVVVNNFQASTHMAHLLSKSLCKLKQVDPSDVISRYLHLYHLSKCNMDETTRLVYEELKASLKTISDILTKEHFNFPMEQIYMHHILLMIN